MTPNEYPTRLDICDGKYTLIIDTDTGRAECLRYGEKWRDLVGDKMVLALFDELVEARARAEAARAETEDLQAKIEALERQEPVGTLHDDGCFVWREIAPHQSNYAGWKMVLYALPGAQTQGEVK